jgi:NAD(P) transhydrogenase subunit beta
MLRIVGFLYLISSVCFILSLKGLSSAKTAKRGNLLGMVGMGIALITTLFLPNVINYSSLILAIGLGGGVGYFIAKKINMTALPQLVAAFHSLVGLTAVFVAASAFNDPVLFGVGDSKGFIGASLIEMSLGTAIGALTFTGSIVACLKLQGIKIPFNIPKPHHINAFLGLSIVVVVILFYTTASPFLFWMLNTLAFVLGVTLILPIGGADMPVIVSMLNSYSGWAACGIGFTLNNPLLVITGSLVGASGAILSYIMCKGMNRSIIHVMMGGFGSDVASSQGEPSQNGDEQKFIKRSSEEDAAYILENARSVIIVPGYGMAVAQAQHALREMGDMLKKKDITVRYAIHPVAGRMPGHMNVLLAEANVPYDDVLELEDINQDFGTTDVVMIVGANDITNPSAKTDPTSPIYGMPVLDVAHAKTVLFIKRSMATGYSGVDNPLFYYDNTMMVLGDAKKVCEGIVKSFE